MADIKWRRQPAAVVPGRQGVVLHGDDRTGERPSCVCLSKVPGAFRPGVPMKLFEGRYYFTDATEVQALGARTTCHLTANGSS